MWEFCFGNAGSTILTLVFLGLFIFVIWSYITSPSEPKRSKRSSSGWFDWIDDLGDD